jgi:hypothetical protein
VELAEAARLRALVAEERPRGPQLHRLRALVHAVLDVRTAEGSGRLGSQRQAAIALIAEREHLLLDDVGRLPHPACEQRGVLERGSVDPPVPGGLEHLARGSLDPLPDRLALGQDVEGAARGLEPLAQWRA